MRIISTIEARMGSTRLPQKTMKEICGIPVLGHVIRQVKKSKSIDDVIAATTTNTSDDVIIDYCKSQNISYYRGSEDDVLSRVIEAVHKFKGDIIVQLGADNLFYHTWWHLKPIP